MNDKQYFERQIKGLMLVLQDSHSDIVHRSYVIEKLKMMLTGGISVHPHGLDVLDGTTSLDSGGST